MIEQRCTDFLFLVHLQRSGQDKAPMRYSTTTLKKLEELFRELDYAVRYEKGSFQSGYCTLEHRRVAVINRFFDTEARINCLLDILSDLEYNIDQLSTQSRELIDKWKKEQVDEN
jgi:hypothetical protein